MQRFPSCRLDRLRR